VPAGNDTHEGRRKSDSDTIFASPAEAAIAAAADVKSRRANNPNRRRWVVAAIVLLILAGAGSYYGPKLLERYRSQQIAALRAKIVGTWCFEKTRYLQVKISDGHIQMVNRRLNKSSDKFVYKAVKLADDELSVRTNGRSTLGEQRSGLVRVQVMSGLDEGGQKAARLRWVPAKTVLNGKEVEAGDPEILVPCGS
jgi:hypothetical protein